MVCLAADWADETTSRETDEVYFVLICVLKSRIIKWLSNFLHRSQKGKSALTKRLFW